MRTLIFLFFGLFMLIAIFVVKRLDARREKNVVEAGDPESPTLPARLEQAAISYRAAAVSLSDEHNRLRLVILDLADQFNALAARGPFSRSARTAIIRLLLSLNDVVQRVTGDQGRNADAPLVDRAAELIAEAKLILGGFVDRANDTALQRLEVDLDVLKDRIDALR